MASRIKRKSAPSHKDIVENQWPVLGDILFNKSIHKFEAHRVCWACGVDCDPPIKAHIKAHAHGGLSTPDNFFLLCGYCHESHPDGVPYPAQIKWLENAPSHIWLLMNRYKEIFEYVDSLSLATRRAIAEERVLERVLERVKPAAITKRAFVANANALVVFTLKEWVKRRNYE